MLPYWPYPEGHEFYNFGRVHFTEKKINIHIQYLEADSSLRFVKSYFKKILYRSIKKMMFGETLTV